MSYDTTSDSESARVAAPADAESDSELSAWGESPAAAAPAQTSTAWPTFDDGDAASTDSDEEEASDRPAAASRTYIETRDDGSSTFDSDSDADEPKAAPTNAVVCETSDDETDDGNGVWANEPKSAPTAAKSTAFQPRKKRGAYKKSRRAKKLAPLAKSVKVSASIAFDVMKKYSSPDALAKSCTGVKSMLGLQRALAQLHAYARLPTAARGAVFASGPFRTTAAAMTPAAVDELELAHTNLRMAMAGAGWPFDIFFEHGNDGGALPARGGRIASWVAGFRKQRVPDVVGAFEWHALACIQTALGRSRFQARTERAGWALFDKATRELSAFFETVGDVSPEESKRFRELLLRYNQTLFESMHNPEAGESERPDEAIRAEMLPLWRKMYIYAHDQADLDWESFTQLEWSIARRLLHEGGADLPAAEKQLTLIATRIGVTVSSSSPVLVGALQVTTKTLAKLNKLPVGDESEYAPPIGKVPSAEHCPAPGTPATETPGETLGGESESETELTDSESESEEEAELVRPPAPEETLETEAAAGAHRSLLAFAKELIVRPSAGWFSGSEKEAVVPGESWLGDTRADRERVKERCEQLARALQQFVHAQTNANISDQSREKTIQLMMTSIVNALISDPNNQQQTNSYLAFVTLLVVLAVYLFKSYEKCTDQRSSNFATSIKLRLAILARDTAMPSSETQATLKAFIGSIAKTFSDKFFKAQRVGNQPGEHASTPYHTLYGAITAFVMQKEITSSPSSMFERYESAANFVASRLSPSAELAQFVIAGLIIVSKTSNIGAVEKTFVSKKATAALESLPKSGPYLALPGPPPKASPQEEEEEEEEEEEAESSPVIATRFARTAVPPGGNALARRLKK